MAVHERGTITFAIGGPIARADLPGLCDRVVGLLERSQASVACCDVSGVVDVDAVTVDALARLALAARRRGCQMRLLGASTELRALVSLTGLGDVLRE
jgi:ABC-type transporter Mla MlaB component